MPKTPNPLEKEIEAYVVNYAKQRGFLCYKFTSPARRSVPDRMFIKNGTVFFIEFKRAGPKPTPAQEVEIKKILYAKVPVHVVDSKAAGKTVIDDINVLL